MTDLGPEPSPHVDPPPAEGPGGVDAIPDWESAGPDPLTPDQPRSAQVPEGDVPDEIEEPEEMDESDGSDASEAPEADSPA